MHASECQQRYNALGLEATFIQQLNNLSTTSFFGLYRGSAWSFNAGCHRGCEAPLKIPSRGGVARSAGVGFRINNPHQVVGYGPKTPPEVPPCPRGDAVFIERGAALGAPSEFFLDIRWIANLKSRQIVNANFANNPFGRRFFTVRLSNT